VQPSEDKPEETTEFDSLVTAFSRDDWRPGQISRTRASGELEAGEVLFGAYEITGKLGEGGMGAVYSARHLSLDGQRAIKVMSPDLTTNFDAVERFHREAKALLDVHHPAVVRCHDLLRDEEGCIFLVMELIDGVPLAKRTADKPLDEAEVRALGERIGAGLAAAHERGVIHRDLSPDNVVLPGGQTGEAKLVDFGIAKILKAGEQANTGGFKGKLAYASPEQLGFYDGEIGPASDFFSLGLLLCGAALGQRLDMGKNFSQAVEARRKPVVLPREIPEALREPLGRLLSLNPAERPQDIAGLFDARRVALERARSRRRGVALAAGGTALALTYGLWSQERANDPFLRTADVSAPAPEASLSADGAGKTEDPATAANRAMFEDVRARLIGAHGESLGASTRFEVSPNPLQDGSTYRLQIEADCDCYPLVFFIDANADSIDLLYPNPNEPLGLLAADQRLDVPSDPGLYSFEAQAGTGIDRLKLLLLPQQVGFPAVASAEWGAPLEIVDAGEHGELLVSFLGAAGGDEFWSATPTERGNLEELAALLDGLEDSTWTSAETVLHVLR